MASTRFKKGVCPNPNGRGGSKEKFKVPPELRGLMARLKKSAPEALEIMLEKMIEQQEDGSVLKNEKIAEKIIKMYFDTLKMSEDMKREHNKSLKGDEEPEVPQTRQESKPRFSLTVVNPQTKDKVKVSNES